MNHRLTMILGLLVLMLSSACSRKAPETLVFADLDQSGNAPVYVALAKGYFADENLTVEIKRFTSGRDALEATLSEKADAGIAYDLPVARAILSERPLRILSTVHRSVEFQGMVVRRDHGIERIADLRGRKVGVVPGTGSVYLLHLARIEAGLQNGDLTEVMMMKPEEGPELLASGAVDALATWPPHIENALAKLPAKAGKVIYVPSYMQVSVLATTPASLVRKREALQRFVLALTRAEDFIEAHDAEARDLVIRHLANHPAEAIIRDWKISHFQLRLDNLLRISLENEIAWLAAQQSPPKTVPDVASWMETGLLSNIRPAAVTLQSR